MKHLSISEQQLLLRHEKIPLIKKIQYKIHLFFCSKCKKELSYNTENIEIINQLSQYYLSQMNDNKINVKK